MGRALPPVGLPPSRSARTCATSCATARGARWAACCSTSRRAQLGCRDAWIGWSGQAHRPRLDRVVRNARFLLFPWVQVKNLASHALGLALRQLPGDWQRQHGLRPLLAETYTNAERHRGTCYQAANWQRVGRTKGSKAKGERPAKPPKEVWVYPLQANWRELLLGARPTPAARPAPRPEQAAVPPPAAAQPGQSEERFRRMWQSILAAVVRLASEHDREWRKRRRVLDTLLVVLFVFRLVFAPERQGYARTLGELWEQCRRQGIALPQPQPVSAASMCAARAKVRPEVFGRIHRAILERAPRNGPRERWHGHRAFAVDGSKLNLPRPLLADGYRTPSETAFYPQGLLSCLFQLRARLPVDFGLHAHGDERRAALAHLSCLAPGDVVVYDRGYYSFRLLHAHAERGLHAVFRLQSNANAVFAAFFRSQCLDATLTVQPSDAARRQSPAGGLRPCRVRLVKYTAGGTTYGLATTLLDPQRYRIQDLSDLYHARWGIEELYRWSSDYPIPRFRAGTVLPPWPPVRWLGADGPVQPETARWPALAAS